MHPSHTHTLTHTNLWSCLHEDTHIGRVAASPHEADQVLVPDVSHALDLQLLLHGEGHCVSVQHLDGHLHTIPLALVADHIPGRKEG